MTARNRRAAASAASVSSPARGSALPHMPRAAPGSASARPPPWGGRAAADEAGPPHPQCWSLTPALPGGGRG